MSQPPTSSYVRVFSQLHQPIEAGRAPKPPPPSTPPLLPNPVCTSSGFIVPFSMGQSLLDIIMLVTDIHVRVVTKKSDLAACRKPHAMSEHARDGHSELINGSRVKKGKKASRMQRTRSGRWAVCSAECVKYHSQLQSQLTSSLSCCLRVAVWHVRHWLDRCHPLPILRRSLQTLADHPHHRNGYKQRKKVEKSHQKEIKRNLLTFCWS